MFLTCFLTISDENILHAQDAECAHGRKSIRPFRLEHIRVRISGVCLQSVTDSRTNWVRAFPATFTGLFSALSWVAALRTVSSLALVCSGDFPRWKDQTCKCRDAWTIGSCQGMALKRIVLLKASGPGQLK